MVLLHYYATSALEVFITAVPKLTR